MSGRRWKVANRVRRKAAREERGEGEYQGDCVAIELSLLVASNSSLIKSLNPTHFKAPTL